MRARAVKFRDARDAAQDVGEMATENPSIGVEFVEDDVTQVLEDARPLGVVRQNTGVQHVGIRENHVAAFANGFARVAGRVAVVSENTEGIVKVRRQILKLGELILRERLGGEEVEGARVGVFKDRVEDREVVAERFSGGRRSNYDEVFSGPGKFSGGGLVGVEAVNPLGAIRCYQFRPHPGGHWAEIGIAGGKVFDRGEDFVAPVARCKRSERLLHDI